MERLTDSKTAENLAANYKALRDAGQPRDIETERYLKLAMYEDREEKETFEAEMRLIQRVPNRVTLGNEVMPYALWFTV